MSKSTLENRFFNKTMKIKQNNAKIEEDCFDFWLGWTLFKVRKLVSRSARSQSWLCPFKQDILINPSFNYHSFTYSKINCSFKVDSFVLSLCHLGREKANWNTDEVGLYIFSKISWYKKLTKREIHSLMLSITPFRVRNGFTIPHLDWPLWVTKDTKSSPYVSLIEARSENAGLQNTD